MSGFVEVADLEAFEAAIEALFAEVGPDSASAYVDTPEGHRATHVVFANGALKVEGAHPQRLRESAPADTLDAIRNQWPNHADLRMYWRVRPQIVDGMLYVRLGAAPRTVLAA